MKYTAIRAYSEESLVEKVNELILEGWIPQGGMAVNVGHSYNIYFYQAMVKHNEK